ncbi:peroxisome- protein [Apophysomyces sp. BC1015]|nr:peroxisome- protein [Apophysomyces sp. BC1015]
MICLYPKLIVFAPQVILLKIIIDGYYKRYGYNPAPSPTKLTIQPTTKQPPKPAPSRSTSSIQQSPDSSKRGAFAFSFASALFPSDESSPEYMRNLQNLQNMMGETSDAYDAIVAHWHHFDWSNEAETLRLLQIVLLSTLVMSVGIWFVPLNLVFLVGGVSMFLSNTRYVKYVTKEMMPSVFEYGQNQLGAALERFSEFEKRLEDEGKVQESSLYENQRWWSGCGFAPQMFADERGAWSNMSGSINLPPKEDLPAPNGYRWIEDNWKLDNTGPWVDDVLGIVKAYVVTPDEGGWIYTDNNWENPTKGNKSSKTGADRNRNEGRVTRRRRWIRRCERNSDSKHSLSNK